MLNKAYEYQQEPIINGVDEDIRFCHGVTDQKVIDEVYENVRTLLCKDTTKEYRRYQFSWGGPSDEVRVYPNGEARYYFMDWFDGAYKVMGKHLVAKLQSVYGF